MREQREFGKSQMPKAKREMGNDELLKSDCPWYRGRGRKGGVVALVH